jgi:hypothetical protein
VIQDKASLNAEVQIESPQKTTTSTKSIKKIFANTSGYVVTNSSPLSKLLRETEHFQSVQEVLKKLITIVGDLYSTSFDSISIVEIIDDKNASGRKIGIPRFRYIANENISPVFKLNVPVPVGNSFTEPLEELNILDHSIIVIPTPNLVEKTIQESKISPTRFLEEINKISPQILGSLELPHISRHN